VPKQIISTPHAPSPAGAFSQGVLVNGTLYTCGMSGRDPVTRELAGDDVVSQTRQVFKNLEAILAAAGMDLTDVVKVTAHLQHADRDRKAFGEVYRELMPEPLPVRTTVGSDLAGFLVEIDVVAVKSD